MKTLFLRLDDFVNKDKGLKAAQTQDEQKNVLNELLVLLNSLRQTLDEDKYINLNTRGVKMSLSYTIQYVEDFIPEVKYHEQVSGPLTFENLSELLPVIIYLESHDELDITDGIFVDDIRKADSDNFMKGLIDISKIDIGILERGDRREIADPLREANDNIAMRLSMYWNQEKLRLVLTADIDPKAAKRKIELDFIGGEGRRGRILDQSPGTRWFMAFVIEYLASQSDLDDTILLLDEPGIMLHAGAQNDLLDRFEDTDPRIQIVYTTHSPYMINKNFPLRIRCVEKGDGTDATKGTYIIQKPYASPKCRAWEPIRSSIGLSTGASLFIGGINLIVEGVVDQILLSSIIQVINKLEGKTIFDLNKVSITFAGASSNLIALAIFSHQETINAKVLLDGDTGSIIKAKLLKADFPEGRIFILNEVMDKKTIDIENLFSPDFYHTFVLEAYQELPVGIYEFLPSSWADIQKDPSDNGITDTDKWGLSKYYKEYFSRRESDIGRFDKVFVARKAVDKIIALTDVEQKDLVKPFEKLIGKIWSQEPRWT